MFDYGERIEKARVEMDRQGIDLLLSVGADLPYLTGHEAMALERLTMLVLPIEGDPTLFVPELEAARVTPGPFQLRPWKETEDPLGLVAAAATGETAAIGDQTWSVFLLGLVERLPGVRFSSATPVTRPLRAVKEPGEVEALQAAAAAADRVVNRLRGDRFEGRSEVELAGLVARLMVEEGHDQAWSEIIASGPNGASPHHEPGPRLIGPGDLVVVDFGGKVEGYLSDCTRTFTVGSPTDHHREVHAAVLAAQEAAKAAASPGVPAEEVDRAARAVITEAGYGPYFIHRTGHGIGLEGHEHPYLVEGNGEVLQPGMCFSIEPGIYLPGRFGVRIEDIVTVGSGGIRSLNDSDRSLLEVS
jgi:D-alanyl-D-alanine dipeptidase